MDMITILNPHSILDVGVGFGKYGVLCREYLELWNRSDNYRGFTRRIDGVEIFEDYLTPLHKFAYDNLYIGDIVELATKSDFRYDLVLLIDILEHLDKAAGRKLVNDLMQRNEGVLLAVPKDIGIQGSSFNNPHERHKTGWTKRQLCKLGSVIYLNNSSSHIVYLGKRDKVACVEKALRVAKVKRFLLSFYIFRRLRQLIKKR
ncbi:MAG: hypothetical protein ABH806_02580 [Candidatus Omnitrophota bacterium]